MEPNYSDGQNVEQTVTATTASGGAAPETILLVEDEDFVRNVTREVLLYAGYSVLTARNASEALDIFASSEKNISLLLTDLKLPGADGCALADQLMAAQPRLKTVVISGYPEHRIKQDNGDQPGTFYLPKPFSSEVLLQKVRSALEHAPPLAKHAPVTKSAAAGS